MKRIGFFVGIDEYQNGIPKLSCASSDAVNMFKAFTSAGFVADLLLDGKAASEVIIGQIQSIMTTLKAGDLFVFYFAGHGREHDSEHYLIGANGFSDSSLYMFGSLPLSAVVSLTDKVPGLKRFFILDCCRKNLTSDRAGEPFQCNNSRNIALTNAVTQNSDKRIIPPLILSSCSTGQMAYENLKTKSGYFTEKFISIVGDQKTVSFSQLQSALTLSVENQDVDWKGPITLWNGVPLFPSWENAPKLKPVLEPELKPKPEPAPEPKTIIGEKLSDPEIIECVTLRMKISSFFNSFSAECFDSEKEALQQKFNQCKENPMDSVLLKAFRNIYASCEEIQKNTGCYQSILKRKLDLEELEKSLLLNKITYPKEYHEKKIVADQLLFMGRYEAAETVLAELCNILNKHKNQLIAGKVELPGGHILEMVQIEPGTFTMGSPANELGRWDNEKQHQVTLTKRFYLGKYPVTQKEYQAVMGNNPSYFKGDNLPVEQVSWDDAKRFCSKLNDLKRDELPAGYRFDLPTEAQWEYACRAGTTTALNNGLNLTSEDGRCSNLDKVAWYDENSDGKTHPVGQKKPNAWGLYDMHGNVWEWCNDLYANYPSGAVTDPTGLASGSSRVLRGGSWDDCAQSCRSAGRYSFDPTYRLNYVGFRVALVPVQ
ncbi:MAG: SUMF1/EgtB/PvdO family nonheme iron enzyme [Lentisphaeria bacterium]|nr:SUMF1/EgtB/PvdO family nonheme iron enzyme [Lentisphaeria bacterium]